MKKNTIKGYSIKDNTIILTKAFAERAYTPGTVEFRILSSLHKAYPTMPIVNRTIVNKNENQEKHEGLTIERMKEIIKRATDKENALKDFEAVVDYYKKYKGYYGKVKAWFLKKYPNYQEMEERALFGDNDETKQDLNTDEAKQDIDNRTKIAKMIERNTGVSNEQSSVGE